MLFCFLPACKQRIIQFSCRQTARCYHQGASTARFHLPTLQDQHCHSEESVCVQNVTKTPRSPNFPSALPTTEYPNETKDRTESIDAIERNMIAQMAANIEKVEKELGKDNVSPSSFTLSQTTTKSSTRSSTAPRKQLTTRKARRFDIKKRPSAKCSTRAK